jgi:hypothetical protein
VSTWCDKFKDGRTALDDGERKAEADQRCRTVMEDRRVKFEFLTK